MPHGQEALQVALHAHSDIAMGGAAVEEAYSRTNLATNTAATR